MTTKTAHKSKPASSSATTNHQERTVMSTASTVQNAFQPIQPIPAPVPAPAPVPTPAPPTPLPIVFVASPPAGVSIPTIEYQPASPGEFRSVLPHVSELTALPQAIKDLAAFTSYQQTFGTAAPDYQEVTQAFTVGAQWTSMRKLSKTWDGYCQVQQGLAWRAIRQLMSQLVPLFAIAAAANPKLLTQYPGLASLLGAKKAIAKKAVSTKQANKKAKAAGKLATHGVVGKKNQRKREKAAAAQVAEAAAPATGAAAPPVGAPPGEVTHAASAPAPAAVAPATNGVAHT